MHRFILLKLQYRHIWMSSINLLQLLSQVQMGLLKGEKKWN
jgi:hypothetical protein